MSNIFFSNIPNIGDLFINKVLLEYELEPVIFVCKDSYNNFFLCICDDFIDTNRSWIVVKLTVQDLLDVISNKTFQRIRILIKQMPKSDLISLFNQFQQ